MPVGLPPSNFRYICLSPISLSIFLPLVRFVSPTSESRIISKLSSRSSSDRVLSAAIFVRESNSGVIMGVYGPGEYRPKDGLLFHDG